MPSTSPLLHFNVSPSQKGTPLSFFLSEQLEISRSKAKSLLDSKAVWVNGKRVWMAKHPLSPGDRVEVRVRNSSAPKNEPLEILFEDSAVIAVQKPAGRISESHPESVEALLRSQCSQPKLRALHRLDRDTSGVLLFLKDPSVRDLYLNCFQNPEMEKRYSVLLAGSLPSGRQEVHKRIDGKTAHSVFQRVTSYGAYCRAECQITTGRTHQIRIHAGALGCRVLGDKQYPAGPEITKLEKGVPRQMLHAEMMIFPCPLTQNRIEIQAPWPTDFTHTTQTLRLL